MAVIDATAGGTSTILVGCSQDEKIALDAAFLLSTRVRALVLIAPSFTGAPEPTHPPKIARVFDPLKEAEAAGDLDRVNPIKARLWLDGPMAPEGGVGGDARRLLLDMNATALRSPPVGSNLDVTPIFHRMGEVSAPS